MDTSDPSIVFDKDGICNHCKTYDKLIRKLLINEENPDILENNIRRIKKRGENKRYDCIIGVSGGVDSSYALILASKMGLRPLAVHLDNGWNSKIAVKNIQKLLENLNVDLDTYVMDWDEFKGLQKSFLYASTPDGDVPTDHAIISVLYKKAQEYGIRDIITGRNIRTETHVPYAWSQGHFDWRYISSVHHAIYKEPLHSYPHRSLFQEGFFRIYFHTLNILNFVHYVKSEAKQELVEKYGWEDYGGKHFESIYTRFYQGQYLPKKFGYDKRRGHLSSLICSGEISRNEALIEMSKDPYPVDIQEEDRRFVLSKLGISEEEYLQIMSSPARSIMNYPSYARDLRLDLITKIYHMFID